MLKLSQMYMVTTVLKTFLNEKQIGVATGFFYRHNERIFLITNKHVIYGNNYGQNEITPSPQINNVVLNLHTDAKDLCVNEEIAIDLFYKEMGIWLEHYYKDVDIVLIPIAIDRTRYLFTTTNQTLIDFSDVQVDDMEKIYVVGYPHGWYDCFNNLPIVRTGHLSSPFRIPFEGKPMMLCDVITHEGMSGSPVLMVLHDFTTLDDKGQTFRNLGSTRTIMIGVYSGQFSNVEKLNLAVIWKSEMIKEILGLNMF